MTQHHGHVANICHPGLQKIATTVINLYDPIMILLCMLKIHHHLSHLITTPTVAAFFNAVIQWKEGLRIVLHSLFLFGYVLLP